MFTVVLMLCLFAGAKYPVTWCVFVRANAVAAIVAGGTVDRCCVVRYLWLCSDLFSYFVECLELLYCSVYVYFGSVVFFVFTCGVFGGTERPFVSCVTLLCARPSCGRRPPPPPPLPPQLPLSGVLLVCVAVYLLV